MSCKKCNSTKSKTMYLKGSYKPKGKKPPKKGK